MFRRNKLYKIVDVRRLGIIAMKLDEDEAIVDVQSAHRARRRAANSRRRPCVRFPVTDVGSIFGRTSMGVRGIALAEADRLISLSILRACRGEHGRSSAYLKMRGAVRGRGGSRGGSGNRGQRPRARRPARFRAIHGDVGAGAGRAHGVGQRLRKRTSSFEYRTRPRRQRHRRDVGPITRNGKLVASFPVEDSDQDHARDRQGSVDPLSVEGIRVAAGPPGVVVCSTPPRTSMWCRSSISAKTPKTAVEARAANSVSTRHSHLAVRRGFRSPLRTPGPARSPRALRCVRRPPATARGLIRCRQRWPCAKAAWNRCGLVSGQAAHMIRCTTSTAGSILEGPASLVGDLQRVGASVLGCLPHHKSLLRTDGRRR